MSALTLSALASGRSPRLASMAATNPARLCPESLAAASSTAQNSGSSATEVRCPAIEKDFFDNMTLYVLIARNFMLFNSAAMALA